MTSVTSTVAWARRSRESGGFYLDEEHVVLAELLRDAGLHTGGFVAEPDPRFLGILEELAREGADFIVVGGIAAIVQGARPS